MRTRLFLLIGAFLAGLTFPVTAEPNPSHDPEIRAQLIELTVETLQRHGAAQQKGDSPRREPPEGTAQKGDTLLRRVSPPGLSPTVSHPGTVPVSLHGKLWNETAYRVSHSGEWTKLKNQLILAPTARLSDDLRFKATGRFTYDPVYDLTDNFPRSVGSDQRMEAQLRDTYLDLSRGPWDFRLGKQQIVWGESVGLFFADTVNAKDLREFVLPDFDLIRIPEWAADVEYSSGDFHAELVWLPWPEFNKLGVEGSEFRFPLPLPRSDLGFTVTDPVEPGNQLENSQIGGRLSILIEGWDLSAFYLHTWDKAPVNFRTIDGSEVFHFTPEYRRLNQMGATFSKEASDVIFKGEFIFNRGGHFSIFDSTDPDGVVRRDFIDYLIGADYTFFDKVDTNLQFMQRVIFNHTPLLADNERRVRNSISLWVKTDFLDGKLEPEFLAILGLMESDFLLRPKLSYKLSDHWRWRLGLDLLRGTRDGTFGKFKKGSRLYSELWFEF